MENSEGKSSHCRLGKKLFVESGKIIFIFYPQLTIVCCRSIINPIINRVERMRLNSSSLHPLNNKIRSILLFVCSEVIQW